MIVTELLQKTIFNGCHSDWSKRWKTWLFKLIFFKRALLNLYAQIMRRYSIFWNNDSKYCEFPNLLFILKTHIDWVTKHVLNFNIRAISVKTVFRHHSSPQRATKIKWRTMCLKQVWQFFFRITCTITNSPYHLFFFFYLVSKAIYARHFSYLMCILIK